MNIWDSVNNSRKETRLQKLKKQLHDYQRENNMHFSAKTDMTVKSFLDKYLSKFINTLEVSSTKLKRGSYLENIASIVVDTISKYKGCENKYSPQLCFKIISNLRQSLIMWLNRSFEENPDDSHYLNMLKIFVEKLFNAETVKYYMQKFSRRGSQYGKVQYDPQISPSSVYADEFFNSEKSRDISKTLKQNDKLPQKFLPLKIDSIITEHRHTDISYSPKINPKLKNPDIFSETSAKFDLSNEVHIKFRSKETQNYLWALKKNKKHVKTDFSPPHTTRANDSVTDFSPMNTKPVSPMITPLISNRNTQRSFNMTTNNLTPYQLVNNQKVAQNLKKVARMTFHGK